MTGKAPETKVVAAAAGGGVAAAAKDFILWLLGVTVWHAPNTAANAGTAVAAVPAPVATLTGVLLTAALVFISGYAAPHTARPDLASSSNEDDAAGRHALLAEGPTPTPTPVNPDPFMEGGKPPGG